VIFLVLGTSAQHTLENIMSKLNSFTGPLQAATTTFFVREANRRYRQATNEELVLYARNVVGDQISKGDLLNSSTAVRDFLTLWLRGRPYEVFATLFLDNQNRLLSADELFRGTIDQTAVYPREIIRRALELNAAAVVFSHNHPSGLAEPSHADRLLTDALKTALTHIQIRVLDHIIVAGNDTYSFAEHGLL